MATSSTTPSGTRDDRDRSSARTKGGLPLEVFGQETRQRGFNDQEAPIWQTLDLTQVNTLTPSLGTRVNTEALANVATASSPPPGARDRLPDGAASSSTPKHGVVSRRRSSGLRSWASWRW